MLKERRRGFVIGGKKINPIIRPFKMADLDRVDDIERKSFPHPWSRLMFKRFHHKEPQGFLVAEREGEVIGYVIVEMGKYMDFLEFRLKSRGHLLNLAVDPQFRRQGVGNALMNSVLILLKEERVEDVWLEVRLSNFAARKLYSKLGFEETGHRARYYWNEDAVIMSLNITNAKNFPFLPVEKA